MILFVNCIDVFSFLMVLLIIMYVDYIFSYDSITQFLSVLEIMPHLLAVCSFVFGLLHCIGISFVLVLGT